MMTRARGQVAAQGNDLLDYRSVLVVGTLWRGGRAWGGMDRAYVRYYSSSTYPGDGGVLFALSPIDRAKKPCQQP